MNHSSKISHYLSLIDPGDKVYVDIGCSNQTNLPKKLLDESQKTVFIEASKAKCDSWKPQENLVVLNSKATPDNVVQILSPHIQNRDITFLDLDIDGYDYYVLESLLSWKKPFFFMAEINEKIPPPLKFTVEYSEDYHWDTSHFFGMSISKLYELAKDFGYDLIELSANNAFLVRRDKNPTNISLTDQEAYDAGYRRPRLAGKLIEFNHNSNVDFLLSQDVGRLQESIDRLFAGRAGKYRCELAI